MLIRGAHFRLKFSSKSGFVKLTLYSPPHIDFNTIPYFTYGCPYRGVKEGKLKSAQRFRDKSEVDSANASGTQARDKMILSVVCFKKKYGKGGFFFELSVRLEAVVKKEVKETPQLLSNENWEGLCFSKTKAKKKNCTGRMFPWFARMGTK